MATMNPHDISNVTALQQQVRELKAELETLKLRQKPSVEVDGSLHTGYQKYREMLESLSDNFFALDRSWRYTYVNQRAAKIVGRSPEQLIGQNLWETYPQLLETEVERVYRRAMESGKAEKFRQEGLITGKWYDIYVYPSDDGITVFSVDRTDQVEAEQAIQRSEERFSKAFQAAPDPISISLIETGILQNVNESFIQFFGYSREELVGKSYLEMGLFVDPNQRQEAVRKVKEKGVLRDYEVQLHTKKGQLKIATLSAETLEIDNKTHMLTIIHDMTERRLAQQALIESEEKFRQLADAMPQLVWTANSDGIVDYYNNRYQQYNGISPDQSNVWSWAPVVHPDDIEATKKAWRLALDTGEMYQVEHRVCMADGSYRWHLSRGVPVCSEDARVLKWFGTATDIQAQKEVEENLRLNEQRIRKLVDANIIGINFRRADGLIYEANDAFLNIIGCSRQDLETGRITYSQITPEEYRQQDQAALDEALKNGACRPYEKEYLRKDGSRVPVLVGYALVGSSGIDLIAFILDLTEVKKAGEKLREYAQKLEQSNRELENFAFMASHDLQEPLRKVNMFASYLAARLEGKIDEEETLFLDRMQNAARRMQLMIDDLLELSRVTTRGKPFEEVDLNEIMLDVISDLGSRIQESHGNVTFDALPTLTADPVQMHQLLQNLVGNALKYHKPGEPPKIKVSGGIIHNNHKPPEVEIKVNDQGIGFNPKYADRIFEPFQRLVGRSEYEGSGMGLAICKKIVERHKGQISTISQEGQGSTFIVRLPKPGQA